MANSETTQNWLIQAKRKLIEVGEAFPADVMESRASEKQIAFQRAFFGRQDDTGRKVDVFVALGGNRSGKSIVCGWLCMAKYLQHRSRAGDWIWCVGQNLDRSVGGQQRELSQALPKWMLGNQKWDEKIGFGMHRKLVLPSADGAGKVLVEFRSCDQDLSTFEQAKLTGVWCDERLQEAIYNRLLARIVDRDGWILYSDIPEQWWQFERLLNAEAAAGVYFQHFRMNDNAQNLPEGAIDRTAAKMTADERKQRIAGEFMVMEGVVYKEFRDVLRPDGHLCKPFAIPADWPKWRVIDYGGSSPTACSWITIAPNECAYMYREYYQRGKSIAENARLIKELSGNETYKGNLIDPHAFDRSPANEVTIADQYGKCGIRCTGWPFVNVMGEHAMVQKVKYRLENNTFYIFEHCVNARREYRSWKYKCDKEGKPMASDAFENDNNHLLDTHKGFFGINPCHGSGGGIQIVG